MIEAECANREDREGHLSWFLWRPWYAKLWWRAAALFWLTAFFVEWMAHEWSRAMNSDLRSALIIGFHPFIIVPVLGLRLYWRLVMQDTFAWPRRYEAENDDDERFYEGETIGFHRLTHRGLGHPIDPRSPLNPINPLYRINSGDL